MLNKQHILFIHIPKTAGTSFRVAAEEYFEKENTFYDYSPQSDETSNIVKEHIYSKYNPYALYQAIEDHPKSFLSGHFLANKYAPLYSTMNVVTFVRNPVAQVISHYNHYKNLHHYKYDLHTFIQEERFRNVQSKMLKGKHLSYYGFIGITEEYELSIELFNAQFQTNLKPKHLNTKHKKSLNTEDIDKTTLSLIKKLNQDDIILYDKSVKQFQIRKDLYANGHSYTYGFIQDITDTQIYGVAFQNNHKVIELDIYSGEEYIDTVTTQYLKPGQIIQNIPRQGYVGFAYNNKNLEKDTISIYVKETKQFINFT